MLLVIILTNHLIWSSHIQFRHNHGNRLVLWFYDRYRSRHNNYLPMLVHIDWPNGNGCHRLLLQGLWSFRLLAHQVQPLCTMVSLLYTTNLFFCCTTKTTTKTTITILTFIEKTNVVDEDYIAFNECKLLMCRCQHWNRGVEGGGVRTGFIIAILRINNESREYLYFEYHKRDQSYGSNDMKSWLVVD